MSRCADAGSDAGKLVLFSNGKLSKAFPLFQAHQVPQRNNNTTAIHAMTPSTDPLHHLAYVFSNVDRSSGQGGSFSLFIVRSTYF